MLWTESPVNLISIIWQYFDNYVSCFLFHIPVGTHLLSDNSDNQALWDHKIVIYKILIVTDSAWFHFKLFHLVNIIAIVTVRIYYFSESNDETKKIRLQDFPVSKNNKQQNVSGYSQLNSRITNQAITNCDRSRQDPRKEEIMESNNNNNNRASSYIRQPSSTHFYVRKHTFTQTENETCLDKFLRICVYCCKQSPPDDCPCENISKTHMPKFNQNLN